MFHFRRYKDGTGCTSVLPIALPVSLTSAILTMALIGWLFWKRNSRRVKRIYKNWSQFVADKASEHAEEVMKLNGQVRCVNSSLLKQTTSKIIKKM